jgi:hypothetical protein
MPKREYDTFCDNPETLSEGETVIMVRELTPENPRHKYLSKLVKAVLARKQENLPEGDVLWLRWQRGRKFHKPWAIKIIEELKLI